MSVQPTYNLSLAELDRRSFLRPFTRLAEHLESGLRVCVEGEGAWLRDLDGRRSLDARAGQFLPPLIITRDEVELIASRFAKGLDNAAASLRAEGVWQG